MSIRDAKPFSEKMALLSRLCGSHDITDQEFRVMFALIIDFLDNRSGWCRPNDETLGNACAKATRTIGRITKSLKDKCYIQKHRTCGAAHYQFPELNKGRSATSCNKISRTWHVDRPSVGRTEPPDYPSDYKPSDSGSTALPLPRMGEASAAVPFTLTSISEFEETPEGPSEEEWGKVLNQNAPPAEPLSENAAKTAVEGYIEIDPFLKSNVPTQRFFIEAVLAELVKPGAGYAILRKGANEMWKQKRRAA